ncbi:MAG: histidinol dehydrogenase [Dehalococcoidales bacterium]|nr:histidinol dehydrogenase [Dehalococcoidales bacterium]
MKIIEGFDKAKKLLDRQAPKSLDYKQEASVKKIIDDVRKRGDAALLELTEKFDGAKLSSLEIKPAQIKAAYRKVKPELIDALKLAAERIGAFHQMQKERSLKTYTHGKTGWMVRPMEKVGVYAPGGTASYPSTVLMTAIPAKVVGVREVILVTPPGKNGSISPSILVAADIAGVNRIFSIGGAQAIAALAFGTESVPRVDKICGPGNIYVMLAKKQVYGAVGIDGLQGPSEVVVIADESADPEYCASDLLAQAEHGGLSPSILITDSRPLAEKIVETLDRQMKFCSRQAIIKESLKNNGMIVIVKNMKESIALTNMYAPEHVLLLVKPGSPAYEEQLTNAGCIIYGQKGTVPMSDYISGPSHVLPTEGTARFFSPLNVTDFVKITNLSSVGDALMNLAGKAASTIARAEGLDAHAQAIELRLRNTRKKN